MDLSARQERSRELWKKHLQYQPEVHKQVQRIYSDYQPSVISRLLGWNRNRILLFTERTAVTFAAYAESPLSDEEIEAVHFYCEDVVNDLHNTKFIAALAAGLLAYRGRKTYRFPLYTPKGDGLVKSSVASPYSKFMWHMARFSSYYVLCSFFATINTVHAIAAVDVDRAANDSRLTDRIERGAELQSRNLQNRAKSSPRQESVTDEASINAERSISERARPGWGDTTQQDSERNISEQARPGWRAPSQQDAWDRVPDDIDDASPVSPTSSYADAGNGGGSAWDRVRQQSQGGYSGRQSGQSRDAWTATRERTHLGGRDNGNSRERRTTDSFSFSSSEEDKVVAKSQSQEEFDRLLERERRGIDQETNSGRRN
ncbi:hypothetical protein CP533_6424 [Ophiocordyceps camponoti-saundersi (nom. inval.)]|nr:hypothetical protein CP533_6424 [Ophiocordyceps camponoti-saundersi (nom. inval.)]